MGSRLAGSVSSSTINIGIPQEKVDELVLDARRSLASARRPGTRHFDLYPAEGPVNDRDRDRWAMPVTGDRDQAIRRRSSILGATSGQGARTVAAARRDFIMGTKVPSLKAQMIHATVA